MTTNLVTTASPDDDPKNRISGVMSLYERIGDLDKFLAESPMLKATASLMGCPVEQAPAVLMHAMGLGMSVIELARNYHWIEGRPSMRADAMLANFRTQHGGAYVVKRRDSDGIDIEFTDRQGNVYPCSLSWQQMLQSPYPWRKDKGPKDEPKPENLKNNYATEMGRRSMMFARLVSDSLRWICPELVAGVYTPEELMESESYGAAHVEAPIVPQKSAMEVAAAAKATTATTVISKPVETTAAPVNTAAEIEKVVDAEYTIGDASASSEAAPETVAPEQPTTTSADPNLPGSITPAQQGELDGLTDKLREHNLLSAERWQTALAKRRCQNTAQLSYAQAAELIGRLRDEASTLPAGN
jgi:hypothetical protein